MSSQHDTDAILTFSGRYRFLSNFWYVSIDWEGLVYPSVEHAYQASKSLSQGDREFIKGIATAGGAKRAGRGLKLRDGWDEGLKVDVMHALLRVKADDLTVRLGLLATGERYLQEGNHWGDEYWGRVKRNGEWVGKNTLGKLLMLVREEIRNDD